MVDMHLARGAAHVCYGGAGGPTVRHFDSRALNMQDWVVGKQGGGGVEEKTRTASNSRCFGPS